MRRPGTDKSLRASAMPDDHTGAPWAGPWGAALVGLGVAVGAIGTHYLDGRIPVARQATLDTAVLYQFVSGLGLLLVAALARSRAGQSSIWFRWAARSLLWGSVLFCGSLYVLIAGGPGFMGAVAPLGGAGMIAGWVLLAVALART